MVTPYKVNVGFYGLIKSLVSVYYVTYPYLIIFRATKIKTLNKYKLSGSADNSRIVYLPH